MVLTAQPVSKLLLNQPMLWHGEVWHARHPHQVQTLPESGTQNVQTGPQSKKARSGKPTTTLVHQEFTYPLFFLTLPLSKLHAASNALLGIDKPRLCMLCTKDHGDHQGNSWLPWIRELLHEEGITTANGEIVMQTFPRVLGYVFNPVSFWFCHDHENRLRAVLCEVNNTFGDHHNYLVAHPDERPIEPADELTARKVFHVSPFFPIAGEYRFRFDLAPEKNQVVIDYWMDDQCVLQTKIIGRPKTLTALKLAHAVLRQPLSAFLIMWRIHWQALRLWLKRVRFHHRPPPPAKNLSR